ncbi:MAG: ADP-ribosylglycohydrolase family protein [Planctomycetaceae bacterium]|jgi:ADP-ribosylglycohydrolase|nr:ADP-ribosylglycohydrolase family protein [Planctomycetaceae bacterium]
MDKTKISGVIFGEAIGDAMGLGSEFLSKERVRQYYPDGLTSYNQFVRDKHRSRWQIGDWTDDTDQMLCIANAIIKDKDIVPQTVAEELHKWFANYPIGAGNLTRQVLSAHQFLDNPVKVSETIWKLSNCQSAPNGSIMRTSVIGLWHKDIEKKAEEVCKLTHCDPRCVGSCVIVSVLINRLVHNESMSKNEIVQLGNRYDSRIKEYVEIATSPDIANLQLGEFTSIGYTLKCMAAGLWAYFNCNNFVEGLKAVINEGGDADTNAAVACSILGAKFGFENIPEYYINGLTQKDLLFQIVEQLNEIINNLKK